MATESKATKVDPNAELFQSRVEMEKEENCRKQWHERWGWLLDEQEIMMKEAAVVREKLPKVLAATGFYRGPPRGRHPLPETSTGLIGWLSTKPDCKLEVYTPWRLNIPVRLPDPWERRDYIGIQHEE